MASLPPSFRLRAVFENGAGEFVATETTRTFREAASNQLIARLARSSAAACIRWPVDGEPPALDGARRLEQRTYFELVAQADRLW